MTLTPELRSRLDAHLDSVDRALIATAHTREQRRAITDDLESQILEMLAAKSTTPALADLEAVLAQLDPPAAYSSATPAAISPPPAAKSAPLAPRYSRTAIWGLVCILLSFLPVLLVIPIALYATHRSVPSGAHAEPAPDLVAKAPRIAATTAPATFVDMMAQRISYSEFMSKLSDRRFAIVFVKNDGNTVTLTGGTKTTGNDHAHDVFATIPAREMDPEAWNRLRAAARETGTQYTIVAVDPAPQPIGPPPATMEVAAMPMEVPASRIALAPMQCLACFIGPLGLLGTILGWIAFAQIRSSKGTLRGKGLALFDGLFYPLLSILLILFMLGSSISVK